MPSSGPSRWASAAAVAAALLAFSRSVGAGETATALRADEPHARPTATISIWDSVFTAAQARRGESAYTGPCSRCHGYKLDGAPDDPDMLPAPPVAGPKFLRKWNGRSLAALLDYTRTTMPENNPSYLSEQEYVDIVAYMLSASGMPLGRVELPADGARLASVIIRPTPARARTARPRKVDASFPYPRGLRHEAARP
jgi:mono/diheme cytochrome c family protein